MKPSGPACISPTRKTRTRCVSKASNPLLVMRERGFVPACGKADRFVRDVTTRPPTWCVRKPGSARYTRAQGFDTDHQRP